MNHDIMWNRLKRELKRELKLTNIAFKKSYKECKFENCSSLDGKRKMLIHVLETVIPRIEREI